MNASGSTCKTVLPSPPEQRGQTTQINIGITEADRVTIAEGLSRLQDESYRADLDMMGLSLPRPELVKTPILVMGAADDRLDSPGVQASGVTDCNSIRSSLRAALFAFWERQLLANTPGFQEKRRLFFPELCHAASRTGENNRSFPRGILLTRSQRAIPPAPVVPRIL
jgi:hypothetical protein